MNGLKNLSTLDVRGNQLESISAAIYRLPNLKRLVIANNPIKETDRNAIAQAVESVQ
jgi:Leucine-rich repeat (LRR) protein